MRTFDRSWYHWKKGSASGGESFWGRTIVSCGVVFALVMIGLCTLSLYQSRQDALEHTGETLDNIALIAERDIERNFELYSLSLQAVADGMADPTIMALPPTLRRQVLFDRALSAQYLGSALILDAAGNIVIDSASDTPRVGNFSDRPYFIMQRDHADVGLFISAPFLSRLRDGSPSIALSRRVSHPDGSFAGIAVITIQLAYFHDLFAGLSLGQGGTVLLLNKDGTLITRQPGRPDLIGKDFSQSPIIRHAIARPGTRFIDSSQIDNVSRLYVFRQFPHLPLMVGVTAAEKDIYASWRHRTLAIGSLMLVFGSGFVVLSFFLGAQFRRRMRAEGELRLLARTDALTGLSNRRTLTDVLDTEWRRAQRTHRVFSLLFVDLDYFKAYNDTYGHQSGDKALATLARCITDNIRRPPDSAARYGGEEFVIVLPDTSEEDASRVAAKLLDAVNVLKIPHRASPIGHLSVSIGIAAWDPERHVTVGAVVKDADEALYLAKAAGRNNAHRVGAAPLQQNHDA